MVDRADLNDLIHDCWLAEEAFDNWDDGKTSDSAIFGLGQREVSLKEVCLEWTRARIKLVEYIMANGEELLLELAKEEDEDEEA